MTNLIGQKLTPVLVEIEDTLLENTVAMPNHPPNYPIEGVRAACYIFYNAMIDKTWALCEAENMPFKEREAMVLKMANDVKNTIKTFTNIDTTKFYEQH